MEIGAVFSDLLLNPEFQDTPPRDQDPPKGRYDALYTGDLVVGDRDHVGFM